VLLSPRAIRIGELREENWENHFRLEDMDLDALESRIQEEENLLSERVMCDAIRR
jgi:hypothetical protein